MIKKEGKVAITKIEMTLIEEELETAGARIEDLTEEDLFPEIPQEANLDPTADHEQGHPVTIDPLPEIMEGHQETPESCYDNQTTG